MKIVKNKKVYDLGYDNYDVVCTVSHADAPNEVGGLQTVTAELRRDKSSGSFYILRQGDGCYSRSHYDVTPVSPSEAADIAESRLDYDQYVKFFGDPEGVDKGLERERDNAVAEAEEARRSKDYWLDKYSEANRKASELETKLAEIQAKLDELAAQKERPCP